MKSIIKKTSSGLYTLPIDSILSESSRIISIEGEINTETATDVCKQIIYLAKENKDMPIKLLITSPGGEVNAGLCIYDCITGCGVPVHCYCIGSAYSMAAIIFAAGTKRYMLENSEVMIHEPLISSSRFSGSTSSVKSISDNMLAMKKRMCKILAKHCCRFEDEIEEAISYDHYFNPREAIDFGLADEVVPFSKVIE